MTIDTREPKEFITHAEMIIKLVTSKGSRELEREDKLNLCALSCAESLLAIAKLLEEYDD